MSSPPASARIFARERLPGNPDETPEEHGVNPLGERAGHRSGHLPDIPPTRYRGAARSGPHVLRLTSGRPRPAPLNPGPAPGTPRSRTGRPAGSAHRRRTARTRDRIHLPMRGYPLGHPTGHPGPFRTRLAGRYLSPAQLLGVDLGVGRPIRGYSMADLSRRVLRQARNAKGSQPGPPRPGARTPAPHAPDPATDVTPTAGEHRPATAASSPKGGPDPCGTRPRTGQRHPTPALRSPTTDQQCAQTAQKPRMAHGT